MKKEILFSWSFIFLILSSCSKDNTDNLTYDFTILSSHQSQFSGTLNIFLAEYDFNQDGKPDFLYGGDKGSSLTPDKITILINDGDGTFSDQTSMYFDQVKTSAFPVLAKDDFNGDGVDDFAIFDAGNIEEGQQPGGGYIGGVPHLYLSTSSTSWAYSDALAQANLAAGSLCWPVSCTTNVHLKYVTTGDIDNDGDIDLFVESGGGYANLAPHFLINNNDGTFTADQSDGRRNDSIIWGDTGYWRYASHTLKDMNNDGFVDLVMGQLRRINNSQDALANKIVFNDGNGNFLESNVVNLNYSSWNGGWTYVKSQLIDDFNNDGKMDILFVHERGNINPDPNGVGNTGRKFQIFIQDSLGGFEDKTTDYFSESQAQIAENDFLTQNNNYNMPKKIRYLDLNQDGLKDIVAEASNCSPSESCPPAYLQNSSGKFVAIKADNFREGNSFGGSVGHFSDINGDGKYDFIYTSIDSGADGIWGNDDDVSTIRSLILK